MTPSTADARVTPDLSIGRLRAVTAIGVLILATAVLTNEWVLGRLVSDDGVLAPLTIARVRLGELALAGVGMFVLAIRGWAARYAPLRALLRERPQVVA